MTRHHFETPLVDLHYYKFGSGTRHMLCFHGYGMHGKQFRVLEEELGSRYTFYGFDLFFHKDTKLVDQSLDFVKKGLSKKALAALISDFCAHENIGRFSVIGYSMGTHYATAIVEELGSRIDEYIVIAPASLQPGMLMRVFSTNRVGNKLLEKIVLSEKALFGLLGLSRRLGFVDRAGHDILRKEMATAELRFNFYASLTYLRFLDTDTRRLEHSLRENSIKSIFVFGKRDKMYPPAIGNKLIPKLNQAETLVLDANHDLIDQNFASSLSALLS